MATRRSKIELSGFKARYYDQLMDVITLGQYGRFLDRVIADFDPRPDERVLDLGAGTGRIAERLARRVGPAGKVMGVEIGPEMLAQFRRRMNRQPNLELVNQRIEKPFDLQERFDRVLISFVLHGFEHFQRILIIQTAAEHLARGGEFCLLDWNERELGTFPPWFRLAFRKLECEQAQDFIARDWQAILSAYRFDEFRRFTYFRGYIRLLRARLY